MAIGRAVEHRFTDAEGILKRLTTETSGPDVWSDLAAVQLAVGEPQDIAAAVGFAEQALRRAPRHKEALFNLALAVERLGLPTQAIVAWRSYLEVDARSPWRAWPSARRAPGGGVHRRGSERARLVLAAIDSNDFSLIDSLVADTPQEVRDALEDELFSRWASAVAADARRAPGADDGGGGVSINAGMAARPASGERAERVRVGSGSAAGAGRGARAVFGSSRCCTTATPSRDASRLFKQAGEVMKRHDHPFWRLCEMHVWAIVYQQNDLRTAFDALQALHARSPRYGGLGARIQWLLGIIAASWSQFDDAFKHYRGALVYYQRAGERDNVAAINSLLADTYLLLGAERQAWASQFEALSVDFRPAAAPPAAGRLHRDAGRRAHWIA